MKAVIRTEYGAARNPSKQFFSNHFPYRNLERCEEKNLIK